MEVAEAAAAAVTRRTDNESYHAEVGVGVGECPCRTLKRWSVWGSEATGAAPQN